MYQINNLHLEMKSQTVHRMVMLAVGIWNIIKNKEHVENITNGSSNT